MANDREVLRIVWEGQIPVCFQVDPDEIDGVQQPENFYLSYLPLVTEKVPLIHGLSQLWTKNLNRSSMPEKRIVGSFTFPTFMFYGWIAGVIVSGIEIIWKKLN